MSLTICFVVYNEEKNLSIIEANLKDLLAAGGEIGALIIDNGSTDNSSCEMERLSTKYKATYIKREQNHLPSARQQAVDWVSTPWIGFVDADCRISDRWIQFVIKRIKTIPPGIVAFGGPWQIAGSWATVYQSLFRTFMGHFGLSYLKPSSANEYLVEHLPTANIVYHRSSLQSVGGFSSGHPYVGEDLDVSCRFQLRNHKVLFLPEMRVEHHLPAKWSKWTTKMFLYGVARGQCLWTYRELFKAKALLPLLYFSFFVLSGLTWHPLLVLLSGFYLVLCLFVSFYASSWGQGLKVFFLMVSTHFFYSLGSSVGFFRAFFASVSLEKTTVRQFRKEPKVGNV